MGLHHVRFTVRRMMVVIAIVAVSWPLFFGIAHLVIYPANVASERDDRQTAVTLEAKKDFGLAADWRRRAEVTARMNRESWSHVVTLLILVVLGIVSAGIGLFLRTWSPSVSSAWPKPIRILGASCRTVTTILFAGLILAGVAYVGFLLLVIVCDD